MLSERGQPLKVVAGYKFRKDRDIAIGIAWRCTVRNCKARIHTDRSGSILLNGPTSVNHNHGQAPDLAKKRICNAVKRKAVNDIDMRPLKLIRTEIAESNQHSLRIKDINNFRQCIYRARRSVLSTLAKSQLEVHSTLKNTEILSRAGENVLLINDPDLQLVGFSTEKTLETLCSSDIILIIGAFDLACKFASHLFTTHVCVLLSKLAKSYENLFGVILYKYNCFCYYLLFTIVANFEVKINSAITCLRPSISIIGYRSKITQLVLTYLI